MKMNSCINFSLIFALMEREGRKRKAPVFKLDRLLKTEYDKLIYAVLSPRSTDVATIRAFKLLKRHAKNFEELSKLEDAVLVNCLKGIGLNRIKASRIKQLSNKVIESGRVPDTLEELKTLPGVGDKVASVFLASHYSLPEIAVDTHVNRIAQRLGLTSSKDPLKTKQKLIQQVPVILRNKVNKAMVAYGQTVCKPRFPLCKECKVREICKYYNFHFHD